MGRHFSILHVIDNVDNIEIKAQFTETA